MGELVGLPEWLAQTLFVLAVAGILFAIAIRNTRRQIAATIARRRNPTREEFIAGMISDVSPRTAAFLWDTAFDCLKPRLTPHPDDDLVKDLPIDHDDWSLDWPRDFAQQCAFDESNLPDRPEGWPTTIRNYGRWLDLGVEQARDTVGKG